MSYSYYTKESYDKLVKELNELKVKGRADIARQVSEARDKGDLSENAEYDAAKNAQGMLELKIAKLQETMSKARVIDELEIDSSKVFILSTVRIRNITTKAEMSYTLVSKEEVDIKSGKISIDSPIGKSLLGKSVGDIVETQVPRGTVKFEIIDISR